MSAQGLKSRDPRPQTPVLSLPTEASCKELRVWNKPDGGQDPSGEDGGPSSPRRGGGGLRRGFLKPTALLVFPFERVHGHLLHSYNRDGHTARRTLVLEGQEVRAA